MKFAFSFLILSSAAQVVGCTGASTPAPAKVADVSKPAANGGAHLSESETRGKEIYVKGTGPGGREIMASMNGVEVRAAVLTCASCHGADGSGRAEGGITPSDIQWETLTKPYGVREADGRKHPPYTDALLARAVTMGLDPAGNRLNASMPRYPLTQEESADLLAYMKRLGKEPEPGLSDTAIQIGVMLPPAPGDADAVRGVLNAYFAKLNATGGVYRRQIDLRFAESSIRKFLDSESVFAFTASFVSGDDVLPLFEQHRMPLVGALTHAPKVGVSANRFVLHLHASDGDQQTALIAFTTAKQGGLPRKGAVVFAKEKGLAQPAESVAQESQRRGWKVTRTVELATDPAAMSALAKERKENGTDTLFFLGPSRQLAALLGAAAEAGWQPTVLLTASTLGPELFELPSRFTGKVFVALPNLPPRADSEAMKELRELAGGTPVSGLRLAMQMFALASAKVLVEGLRRTGRELSRAKLLQSLEGMSKFETGLTPPLTFDPNRRVSASGAYIVELDRTAKDLVPVSDWIEANRLVP